jgi:FAD:protein FMN transferase
VTSAYSVSRDALAAAFSATGTAPAVQSREFDVMGTTASIMLVGGSEGLLDAAVELVRELESTWSRFVAGSEIWKLNWSEGRPTAVSSETERLIRAMVDGVDLTDGAFDPTLLPDLIASGYAASMVDPSLVTTLPASARSPGSLRGIRWDESGVTLPRGTTLDPGGIGKGLAADMVCEFAIDAGAWGAMAEIGGDITVVGRAPDGVAWPLGVQDPFAPDEHLAVVRLTQGALATSSQRKRRFVTDSGEHHHLIDPISHGSAATMVQTVTVIAATGARAETMTKPGFLRDTREYLQWLPSVGGAGMVIDESGVVSTSDNWGRYL